MNDMRTSETAVAEAEADPVERPRILLVDDDQRNLIALTTVIEDLGEVVTASSGEEALRELLHGDFAVILLDVFMPDIDGYETARLIRGRRQSARIPVIFLSAVNKEEEHLMRGYEMGAVDYVFKPVEPRVLRSKVAVFVDLYAMQRDVERKAATEQRLMTAAFEAREQRLAAEDELQRTRRRQATIISAMPFLLFSVDESDGSPRFLEDNFEALTGFPCAAASEAGFWLSRVHPEDVVDVGECFAERSAGRACSCEYRWQDAKGNYRHFLDQAAIGDGEREEMVGSMLDVTDRRNLESQLIQAQKMDAIGQLTGGIAHDFNNLLAAVLGGLRILKRRANLTDEHIKLVEMTEHAASQGAELIARMLAFSRKQQLSPGAVELERLESSVRHLLEHSLGGLVEVVWKIDPDAPPVFADAGQLELAVMNLVINARDAMPDGGKITVECAPRDIADGDASALAPGRYVCIAVDDEGSGIPADRIAQVTEPFYTTKEVGKGTGLGLSMVYGFSRQSGGDLVIESEVGKGTRIEIWLPAVDQQDLFSPAIDAEDDNDPSPALGIVLVDDDSLVRATTAEMLRDLGHDVRDFGSAAEALDALESDDGACDLIMSDYAMPRMSGLELLERARLTCPTAKSILITGYADINQIAKKANGVPLLGKPFKINRLKQAISTLFKS